MRLCRLTTFFSLLSLSSGLLVFSTAHANASNVPTLLQKPSAGLAKNHTQPKGKHLINEIVAIVNDQAITLEELNAEVIKIKAQINTQPNAHLPDHLTLQRQALQQIINQTIALQMAKRQGIQITDDEAQAAIANIAMENDLSIGQLKAQVQKSGLSFQDYFETIKKQLTVNKLQQRAVAGKVYVSPKDIDKYINKHFSQNDTQYQVQNILIPLPDNATEQDKQKALTQANQIISDIDNDKITFAQAAKKYSQSSNADQGGDLGWKTLSQLPESYADKVKDMTNDSISAPFIANNGVQILRLITAKVPDSAKHFVEQYHVYQISIDLTPVVTNDQAKAKLERILSAFKNGESFETLAKANSQDRKTAEEGGDMGWVALNTLPPEAATQVKAAKLKQVTQPFLSGKSWKIIEVRGERQYDDTQEYQKQQATMALFNENAQQALKTWMLSLRDSAYVEILAKKFELPKS